MQNSSGRFSDSLDRSDLAGMMVFASAISPHPESVVTRDNSSPERSLQSV
jgi:hypothetical protein